MSLSNTQIFPPFHFDRWRAVDDRVRGGSSISHFDSVDVSLDGEDAYINPSTEKVSNQQGARFWGNLGELSMISDLSCPSLTLVDISTLGGAGFASQTHLFGPAPLQLSRVEYEGLRLSVLPDEHASKSSPSNFTLILKNTIRTKPPKEPKLPPQPEPAVLSYEVSFPRPSAWDLKHKQATQVDFAWSDFKPHYRGREVPRDDEKWKPLDTEAIYEISFMCRSGFGKQEGDFGVVIAGLWGLKKGNLDMSKRVMGAAESWSAWFASWWSWIWSWFSSSGRIRLDEKV
jgi:hypothetical protein